jgi:hypothetical protein
MFKKINKYHKNIRIKNIIRLCILCINLQKYIINIYVLFIDTPLKIMYSNNYGKLMKLI